MSKKLHLCCIFGNTWVSTKTKRNCDKIQNNTNNLCIFLFSFNLVLKKLPFWNFLQNVEYFLAQIIKHKDPLLSSGVDATQTPNSLVKLYFMVNKF